MTGPESTEPRRVLAIRTTVRLSPYVGFAVAVWLYRSQMPTVSSMVLTASILWWVVLLVGRRAAANSYLDEWGVNAPATVVSCRRAGTIDHIAASRVVLRVAPLGQTPFEVAGQIQTDPLQALRLASGQPIVVTYLDDRRRVWRVDWNRSGPVLPTTGFRLPPG